MSPVIRRLVFGTTAAAVLSIAAAVWLYPIQPAIGGWPGLVFWIALTLVGSALPVRLPQGVVVSVSAAPLLATVLLNVQGRDVGGFVAEARATVARTVTLPAGY